MDKIINGCVTRACRSFLLPPVLLLGTVLAEPAIAQPPLEREPVRTLEQNTERIVHQDAGSRIEELRVGGQTRRIDVQTATDIPAYQVQPLDPSLAPNERQPSGARSWRVLNF